MKIIAGTDAYFTFDHVFGVDSTQSAIYDDCVAELLNGENFVVQLCILRWIRYGNLTMGWPYLSSFVFLQLLSRDSMLQFLRMDRRVAVSL